MQQHLQYFVWDNLEMKHSIFPLDATIESIGMHTFRLYFPTCYDTI